MDHLDHLRRAFRDICAGHTRGTILGRPAFIKHLSHVDQVDLDTRRAEFYEEARVEGLETDEQALAEAIKRGEWSDEKERKLARAKLFIAELEEGKRKAIHPSMVTGYVQKIDEAIKDYKDQAWQKRCVLGLTCEVHADRELNDLYIVTNLYSDAELTKPLFSEREFNHLKDDKVDEIVQDYNCAMEGCTTPSIKRLALQGFFQYYFQLAGDDLTACFGRPIFQLTFPQVELLRWGSHFRTLYANHDVSSFPPNVREDPDLLTDYAATVSKGKAELAQQGANEEGAIVMGLKKEDEKALGVKSRGAGIDQNVLQSKFGGNLMAYMMAQQAGQA